MSAFVRAHTPFFPSSYLKRNDRSCGASPSQGLSSPRPSTHEPSSPPPLCTSRNQTTNQPISLSSPTRTQRYDADGGQTELKPHRDGSVVSFNIALNPSDEFEGGGTYFAGLKDALRIEQVRACVCVCAV